MLSVESEKSVENVKIDSQNLYDENFVKREICESMCRKLPEILTQTLPNADLKMDHKIEVDYKISRKIPSNETMTKIDSLEDNLFLEEKIRPVTEYFNAAKNFKEYDLRPRDVNLNYKEWTILINYRYEHVNQMSYMHILTSLRQAVAFSQHATL